MESLPRAAPGERPPARPGGLRRPPSAQKNRAATRAHAWARQPASAPPRPPGASLQGPNSTPRLSGRARARSRRWSAPPAAPSGDPHARSCGRAQRVRQKGSRHRNALWAPRKRSLLFTYSCASVTQFGSRLQSRAGARLGSPSFTLSSALRSICSLQYLRTGECRSALGQLLSKRSPPLLSEEVPRSLGGA